MNKTLQELSINWWDNLSVDDKVSLCNKRQKSVEQMQSQDIIDLYYAEAKDRCLCGVPLQIHNSVCGWENASPVIFPWETSIVGHMSVLEKQIRWNVRNENEGNVKLNLGTQIPALIVDEPLPEGIYCRCENCRQGFFYDLIVPDVLWAVIAPKPVEGFKGGGLLCPECILNKTIDFYTGTIQKYVIDEDKIINTIPADLYPNITSLEGRLVSIFQYLKTLEVKYESSLRDGYISGASAYDVTRLGINEIEENANQFIKKLKQKS